MIDKTFGKSGNRTIIEEYLQGPEVTVLAFCDGSCSAHGQQPRPQASL